MHIPRFMRHVNRVFTNPIMGPLARVMPPLAVVHHVGRTSGRNYSTPVVAFRSRKRFVIPMTYGRDVDWARNIVKAHGCQMEQMGRRFTTSNPRVVDFDAAEQELPGAVREAFRIADLPGYVLLDLQSERTGSSPS
jgi:deazaflavin-dependent oxidoreductase (nitroreductase family)